MGRKGEMINEFRSLIIPMDMEDKDKVVLYLFQSSSQRDGKRFSMSKPETIMARLGWRNLDRVDQAVAALEAEGRVQPGRSVSPFDRTKIVEGFFVGSGVAPPELSDLDLETSEALFGIPNYDVGDEGVEDDGGDLETPDYEPHRSSAR